METLSIQAGPFMFAAKLEVELAPKTCAVCRQLLPFENLVIHSRWSGEAVWIPLGLGDELPKEGSEASSGDDPGTAGSRGWV